MVVAGHQTRPKHGASATHKRLQNWLKLLQSELSQPAIASVLAVVLGFNIAVKLETVQQNFPFIRTGQLAMHRFLCAMSSRAVTPKWVRTVEIDDKEHDRQGEPTNRAFLARLVSHIADGDPLAIVLDIKLLAPPGMSTGQDDSRRSAENALLLKSVREAAARGVSVVLTTWLKRGADGDFVRLPNIYSDSDLPLPGRDGLCSAARVGALESSEVGHRRPTCARVGNINLPVDKRRIALQTPTADASAPSESLALAAVSAYEEAIDREPKTVRKPYIASAIRRVDSPFASFIPETAFQKIPVHELANGEAEAIRLCRGRIVVIGGTWSADSGRGEPVDRYGTPVGPMRGMYLHANYIEALLDDRYAREVPLWIALLFDFGVGAWLYVAFHQATRGWNQIRLLLIPASLLVASYITFANLNVYLDFILPLGGYFVHLAVEYMRDYRELSKHSAAGAAEIGVA